MLPNPLTGQLECLPLIWFQCRLITHSCNRIPFSFLLSNNIYIKLRLLFVMLQQVMLESSMNR